MAVRDSFLAFVLEQLEAVRNVTSRKMFGGVGLYSDGSFFALIDNNTLYFKVNDETRPAFVDAGMGPFRPYADRPDEAMNGYYAVPVSVLEDRDELATWAGRAVGVAESAKARRPKRAPRKKIVG
jgi:DNA transformation protein